jgi:hypothetical protein
LKDSDLTDKTVEEDQLENTIPTLQLLPINFHTTSEILYDNRPFLQVIPSVGSTVKSLIIRSELAV